MKTYEAKYVEGETEVLSIGLTDNSINDDFLISNKKDSLGHSIWEIKTKIQMQNIIDKHYK